MSTVQNWEKIQEELEKNPYYEKYANKIDALQKKSPKEFMSRLKEIEEKKTTKPKEPKQQVGTSKTAERITLADVMKLDLVEGKNADEISQIWYEFHKSKECVSNVISTDVYKLIVDKSKKNPTFLLPVPKDSGYEFHLSFFQDNCAHFTQLEQFKQLKDRSPVSLEINYFTELSHSKNIVLIRGKYDSDVLTKLEANCLSSAFILYYGDTTGKHSKLLDIFTNSPEQFQHMDLIADFELYSQPKPMLK